jgi:HAD superfamily hydrolase (TIGR01509 family)
VIQALVFDFDGLILDTEGPVFAAWCAAFEAHGCALTLDDWAAEIGTVQRLDLPALLHERATVPVDEDAMHAARRARRDQLLAAEGPRPGVLAWLDDADALGLRVAIASSSEYEWVDSHLRYLALRGRFAHLACYGDELAAKPAPDTYLAACRDLDVDPGDALAIEDSPNGIAAAKAAGLRCVAVPNPITERLDLSAADLLLTSLAERSLGDVMEDFGTR